MVIRKIKLINFRSHKSLTLEFNTQTTEIIGENGCGKTSVLEAIYEVMQGKSFRSVDREILRRGAEFYRIELEYIDGRRIVAVYSDEKKDFLAEDKKTRRLAKKNKYPIVLFEPSDLNLVSSSPTSKRNYFDRMFGQLMEQYGVALTRYNKALKQRNELLKQEVINQADLFSWNVMLAKYGTELRRGREEFVGVINQKITESYRSIASNSDTVGLEYQSEISDEDEFLRKLEMGFERDRLLGHTGFGVHRDGYEFRFNDSKAEGSASRGEVRSMVIALKFIEAEMITERTQKRPVVLLDDVFSELDEARQQCLVKNFCNNQVILTSVNAQEENECVRLTNRNN